MPGLSAETTRNALLAVEPTATTVPGLLTLQEEATQRVLVQPDAVCLVLAELQPCITLGRRGSVTDLRFTAEDYHSRAWEVHHLAHGGSTMLHLPGQVSCYPVFRLQQHGLCPHQYAQRFLAAVVRLLHSFSIAAEVVSEQATITIAQRPVARLGVAVNQGITRFGVVLNVSTDLADFARLQPAGEGAPMTSLHRESQFRLRTVLIRRLLVQALCEEFHWKQPFLLTPPQPLHSIH